MRVSKFRFVVYLSIEFVGAIIDRLRDGKPVPYLINKKPPGCAVNGWFLNLEKDFYERICCGGTFVATGQGEKKI